MPKKSLLCAAVLAVLTATTMAPYAAQAKDLKITIPRRSLVTPVQKLNREGVEAVRKHDLSKAEKLFYRAYLFDPEDSFTLNNLGYVAELQRQVERAAQFYALAAARPTDAVIDMASSKRVEGKPMKDALAATTVPLQINHANVEAVRLLSEGRAAEADLILQGALQKDPQNVFTLNNMGAAKEMEGEEEEALRYFDQASRVQPGVVAIVTADLVWRGRPVSRMAQENAKALRNHLAHKNDLAEQVAELNLRGVSAVNRNDLRSAETDFRKAYALDPNNPFSLNNIGYVSEMKGDRETAEFFYQRAREALGASAVVGVATRTTAEGKPLSIVAEDSDSLVTNKVSQERDVLRRENGPVVLRRRDNSIVNESIRPAPSSDSIQAIPPAEPSHPRQ
jgi:Flp pilus assembly protein TadD